jgi:hypothetical protein
MDPMKGSILGWRKDSICRNKGTTSGMQITPLRRADIPELSQFLISGFGVPATAPFFSHEVLAWKYFDGPSGPSENSACSLIARSAGRIIGHIGMCPRQFIVSGDGRAPVSTMHAIDWLGSAGHPGVGALLMLQALATSKTQYAVGGAAPAQVVFPRLGFEQKPRVIIFRKVLTPCHRLRTTGQGLFRKWGGTAKDMVSVWRTRTPLVPQTVELRPAPTFTEEINCLQQRSSLPMVTCRRDHLLLNYFLRFPRLGFSGWKIHTPQEMIGFAVLKVTPHGRIRLGTIVDCWLDTEDTPCWQAAAAALIERLRAFSADQVKCFATTPSLHGALLWNGFAGGEERNVYVRDKEQSLPPDLPFGFSMLDADGAIL